MKRLKLTEAAEADIQAAFVWYEAQREGLGEGFLDRVDEAVGVIARNPEGSRQVMPGVRHVGLKKFPYALWYVVRQDVTVFACLHGRQAPSLARKRAKG